MQHSGVRWSTPHQQSTRLLIVTAVAASSAALAQYWTGIPWWLLLALCAVAGVGTPLVWWLRQRAASWDQREHAVEATIRSAFDAGALPRTGDSTLQLFGVHRAPLHMTYLTRNAHAEIVTTLQTGEPTLLLGHAMAGKSRLGAEVVRQHYPELPLVVPAPPRGLAQLFSAGGSPMRTVIWLDDLERYLGDDLFRVEWLDRAIHAENIVVATMRSRPYEQFLPHGDLQRAQWELLERFRPVWLHANPDERRRLAGMIDDPRMRAGVLRYGLAEYLGGAVLAIERLHAGESEHPLGAAMVHAAADWRRMGLDSVPEPILGRLARRYLPEPGRRTGADRTTRAIEWASELIDHTVALLEPTAGGWRAFDPVVDHVAAEGRPVPDSAWNAALRSAGDRLIAVCHTAAAVHHRQDIAERAWRRALERDGDTAVLTARLLRDLQGSAPDASWWTDPPSLPDWLRP